MATEMRKFRRALGALSLVGASDRTLMHRVRYGGRKGRSAARRLAHVDRCRKSFESTFIRSSWPARCRGAMQVMKARIRIQLPDGSSFLLSAEESRQLRFIAKKRGLGIHEALTYVAKTGIEKIFSVN